MRIVEQLPLRAPRPRRARAAVLLAALAAALPAAPPAGAAERKKPAAEQREEPTFFEVVDVRVVNVDVVVTDRQGRPVTGLTRDDFELLENGRPVEIAYFYAEVNGRPADAAAAGEDAAAPAEGAAAAPEPGPAPPAEAAAEPAPAEPSPEQRLHLALLIDDQSLTPPNRNRLLPALRRFLAEQLRPGDRLLLARFEGGLAVESLDARDDAAVDRLFQRFARSSSRGADRRVELVSLLRSIQEAPLPSALPGEENQPIELMAHSLLAQIRAYGQARFDETRRTLATVSALVEGLAGLPGRKAVLYVGGGFSLRPAEAVYRAYEGKYGRIARAVGASIFDGRQLDATSLLRDVTERANAGRVTLYALGAPDDLAGIGIEIGGMEVAALNSPGGGITWGSELAATETFNLNQPLEMLAGPTGGVAAFDTPQPTGLLATLRQDISTYYSLGFVPERRDGKPRRLDVRVRREGLRVRHREAYREASGRERASRRTRSAMLLGWTENPLDAALEIEGTRRDRDGVLLLDLLVMVPMAKLVLLPQSDFHEGRLTLFIGAKDERGRASDLQEIAVPIRVPNDQLLTALGQTVAYRARLRLRPLEHTVAVGVRDELGNVEATVTTRFVPGEPAVGPGG